MNYIFLAQVPIMILFIILIGIKEKKDVFALFIEGIKKGIKVTFNIFPYILAILVAIGIFRNSGALSFILKPLEPLLNKIGVPSEIVPLIILRPLSGGASMSIALDIFKNYGVDSVAGKITSLIMASTETTFYCITILFSSVKIKKIRGTMIAGIFADICAIVLAIVMVKNNFF